MQFEKIYLWREHLPIKHFENKKRKKNVKML